MLSNRPRQFGRGRSWRRPGGLIPGTASEPIDLDTARKRRQTERLAGSFRETSRACPVLGDHITDEECRGRRESLLRECETCNLNPRRYE